MSILYKSSFLAPLVHWRGLKGGDIPPLNVSNKSILEKQGE